MTQYHPRIKEGKENFWVFQPEEFNVEFWGNESTNNHLKIVNNVLEVKQRLLV